MTKIAPKNILLGLLSGCLVLAACGSSESATTDTIATEAAIESEDTGAMEDDAMEMEDGESMEDGDHSHDDSHGGDAMEAMSMGDVNATPADDVEGAEITTAEFALLDSRPEGFDDLTGTATIARYEGTTVTIEFEGLEPGMEYISHLHSGSCDEGGGPHFKFDPDGSDVPPNEIHLAFGTGDDGSGFMTAENDQAATSDAQSVVVHLASDHSAKIACAQF